MPLFKCRLIYIIDIYIEKVWAFSWYRKAICKGAKELTPPTFPFEPPSISFPYVCSLCKKGGTYSLEMSNFQFFKRFTPWHPPLATTTTTLMRNGSLPVCARNEWTKKRSEECGSGNELGTKWSREEKKKGERRRGMNCRNNNE